MSKKVSANVILETRVKSKIELNQPQRHPVKLRVTFSGKHSYYTIVDPTTKKTVSLSVMEYADAIAPKSRGKDKELRLLFAAEEARANEIISGLKLYNPEAFKKSFLGASGDAGDVLAAFDSYTAVLTKEGRIGTASSYRCARNSLARFAKEKLQFAQITVDFLKKYEQWMLKVEDNSKTTVGFYCRALRTIMNQALSAGSVSKEAYPFGAGKFEIPSAANIKKALDRADLAKIHKYKPVSGTWEERAIQLWMFSYLCNGMNMKDIALLKWRNLDGDKIIFKRAKTSNTRRKEQKPITAQVTEEVTKIIASQGSTTKLPDDYIFPILEKGMTPTEQFKAIQQFVKMVNFYNKRTGEFLKIRNPITTYVARHSHATALHRAGVGIAFISESLGHSSQATTSSYLGSFGNDAIKKNAAILTDFGD